MLPVGQSELIAKIKREMDADYWRFQRSTSESYNVFSKVYTFPSGNSIYISSRDMISIDTLSQRGIYSVLSLGDENELCSAERSGLKSYMCLTLSDSDKHAGRFTDILPEARLFIHTGLELGSVLVHCRAGISRSPAVVIDFISKATKMTMQEALGHVKSKRDCVDPRQVFLDQI